MNWMVSHTRNNIELWIYYAFPVITSHSDLAMTDRYSHLTMDRKRSRQKKLAEHYSKATEQEEIRVG